MLPKILTKNYHFGRVVHHRRSESSYFSDQKGGGEGANAPLPPKKRRPWMYQIHLKCIPKSKTNFKPFSQKMLKLFKSGRTLEISSFVAGLKPRPSQRDTTVQSASTPLFVLDQDGIHFDCFYFSVNIQGTHCHRVLSSRRLRIYFLIPGCWDISTSINSSC